ncbi:unnamed protein product [Meloidogyne enterolobii]|uniref:Uncharacterized protein n=1 Tax=Meloidogyne enterolobii TaxID=390850 RepID=A0ACB0Z4D1_MELEN
MSRVIRNRSEKVRSRRHTKSHYQALFERIKFLSDLQTFTRLKLFIGLKN